MGFMEYIPRNLPPASSHAQYRDCAAHIPNAIMDAFSGSSLFPAAAVTLLIIQYSTKYANRL